MSDVTQDVALLRAALIGLIGAETEAELRQMEVIMRTLPVPDADRAASINAIHALLATMPASQGEQAWLDDAGSSRWDRARDARDEFERQAKEQILALPSLPAEVKEIFDDIDEKMHEWYWEDMA
ncbi:hypothetical protein [Aeromonas enteropelogenes]|uniref:hypothetical protein n=1 Tax=Aeromonas enteropelogenes TaxID=29489 RepID=UPI003BA195BA